MVLHGRSKLDTMKNTLTPGQAIKKNKAILFIYFLALLAAVFAYSQGDASYLWVTLAFSLLGTGVWIAAIKGKADK